jgi:hypothetical protein
MSQHEEELRRVLLNLLRIGLLRIRVFGWNGDAGNCAIEAGHLHNLPGVAREPRLELLSSYYNVERPICITQAKGTAAFEADWNRLGAILAEIQHKGIQGPISE